MSETSWAGQREQASVRESVAENTERRCASPPCGGLHTYRLARQPSTCRAQWYLFFNYKGKYIHLSGWSQLHVLFGRSGPALMRQSKRPVVLQNGDKAICLQGVKFKHNSTSNYINLSSSLTTLDNLIGLTATKKACTCHLICCCNIKVRPNKIITLEALSAFRAKEDTTRVEHYSPRLLCRWCLPLDGRES